MTALIHNQSESRQRTRNACARWLALTTLCWLSCAHASAQTPTIGPQVRIDSGGFAAANETTITAATTNPRTIAAAWNDSRTGLARIGLALSTDGGRTWRDTLLRPPSRNRTLREGDPMTAHDPSNGDLWIGGIAFNSDHGGVFVARKPAAQADFDPPTMAHIGDDADKGFMAVGPDPYYPSHSRLYIAFNKGLIHSTDAGRSWSDPIPIGMGVGFQPRVGPAGELYIIYWDGAYGIRLRRSFDGGRTLDPAIRVAERLDTWPTSDGSRLPGSFRAPPLSYFAVDPRSGDLYCVYFDTTAFDGKQFDVDLYMTKSVDRGTTWSVPKIVAANGHAPGDQFFPWIEVDHHGRLHLLFFDTRNTQQPDTDDRGDALIDTYYAFSENGGDTWREFRLTPHSFSSADTGSAGDTQFLGDYVGLAIADTTVIPCYPDTHGGDPDVYVHRITFPRADGDRDGDTDSDDFRVFSACTGGRIGSGLNGAPSEECVVFDHDRDGDLDLLDFAELQGAFSGDCGVRLIHGPDKRIACLGERVVMHVQADGDELAYRWHHNAVDMPHASDASLVIESVRPESAGDYHVTVIGRCGVVQSAPALLTVQNCGDNP